MCKELESGTIHHNFMHSCNNRIERIKSLTKHIDIHGMLDDWREDIEKYVMENIEASIGGKNNETTIPEEQN